MLVTSEDEDKPASSGVFSATEEYEGDEGESYRGEEEDDDEDVGFGESFGFGGLGEGDDGFDDAFDEYDDEYDDDGSGRDDNDSDSDGGNRDDMDDVQRRDGADSAHGGGVFDDQDDGTSSDRLLRPQRSRAAMARATTGPLPLPQHNFAPPFYGRPPTPLPPSPSLTSLLRPSRPTTPDATDDEMEPVPRAAPQVPTYEYYGFVLYLFSSLAFLIYLLWSYLPSPFLHALGIYYYPNRWWSLAIPSFLVMTLVYIYIALACYNTEILTLPLDSIETIVDGAAKLAAVDNGSVVIVGGVDGFDVQGRGPTASASEHSAHRHRHLWGSSSQRHSQSQPSQPSQPPPQKQHSGLQGADTIASWPSSKPFTHQREPSSPSPPLGKAAWRDRAAKSNRDRKNKKGASSGPDAADHRGTSHADTAHAPPAVEDAGLTMSGRGRGWNRHTDGHVQDYDRSSHASGYLSSREWNRLWNTGTDAVMDIPLAGVCEVLYA